MAEVYNPGDIQVLSGQAAEDMLKSLECPDCTRHHTQEMACPRRIAKACVSPTTPNIEAMTRPDRIAYARMFPCTHWSPNDTPKAWEDLVEEAITKRLMQ